MPAKIDADFRQAFRAGTLPREQAERHVPTDRGARLFLLMQLSVLVGTPAPAGGANTPSGTIPPYQKPEKKSTRQGKKRGGQPGHDGPSRTPPVRIDRRETHPLPACPNGGGERKRTGEARTRVIEDIPDDLQPEVVEHTIHRDWCPCCRQQVEPKVPDAWPKWTLGHRTLARSAWLYDGLGVTISPILQVFNGHLVMKWTAGGLLPMGHRLALLFEPWDDQIHRHCLDAGVWHADETGGRVDGETWWMGCFRTNDATDSRLDRSRGHPALNPFFIEEFPGIRVSDFWSADDAASRLHQKCWPHLWRELKEVHSGKENGDDGSEFDQKWRRVSGDALRWEAARPTTPADAYGLKQAKLPGRLIDLAATEWTNAHARRLAQRWAKYGNDWLTFVEFEGVPADNNPAEREVRPAVRMRKASDGHPSERGAKTRAVLMTVSRTLKRRGHDPLAVVIDTLRTDTTRGELPPLPGKIASAD